MSIRKFKKEYKQKTGTFFSVPLSHPAKSIAFDATNVTINDTVPADVAKAVTLTYQATVN